MEVCCWSCSVAVVLCCWP